MIAAYNALGQTIFRTLAQSAGNIVISPLSIGVILAMGFAAAAGETADEMARALGFDGARADLFKASADLLRHYGQREAPEAPLLRLANALVLAQHGAAVAEAFRDLLADSFAAEIFQGDVERLNRWVAQKTEGRIEHVLDSLPQDDIAVLVNAIYFKAPWAKPFNPTSTYDGRFFQFDPSSYGGRGRFFAAEYDDDLKMLIEDSLIDINGVLNVRTMHIVGDHVIAQGAGYRAARLPYKPTSLSMIIILPDEYDGLDAVLAAFDIAELAQLRTHFEREMPFGITLELPRFRAHSDASLKTALQQAGMVRAFDWTRADFSGMTERPPAEIPVAISDILHSTAVDVSEEGTEAAGKTLMMYHIGGASPDFIVDHPFLFFIVDDATGAILFQGKIVDPR